MPATFPTPGGGSAPRHSLGTSTRPTPTMHPCSGMRRGTESCVPIVPGFVSVIVVPVMSSGARRPSRARAIASSYAARKVAKSIRSALFTLGTRSARVPSERGRSTASPRFTASGTTTPGLPPTVEYARFITGTSASARTTAHPMRCVNEIFSGARWRLIVRRFSSRSEAGTNRMLVAVGTPRLRCMFSASRAAAPVSGCARGSPGSAGAVPEGSSPPKKAAHSASTEAGSSRNR